MAALNEVRAAGGVVWRRRTGPGYDVLLVHRPKYDDWTLPKGKADDGESDEDCALREVEEETGLRCLLGPELVAVDYRDRYDRPKHVRYWTMEPVSGRFARRRGGRRGALATARRGRAAAQLRARRRGAGRVGSKAVAS